MKGLTDGGGGTLPGGAVATGGADGEVEATAAGEAGTEAPGDVDGTRGDEAVGKVAPGVALAFGAGSQATRAITIATSIIAGASRDAPLRADPMAKAYRPRSDLSVERTGSVR